VAKSWIRKSIHKKNPNRNCSSFFGRGGSPEASGESAMFDDFFNEKALNFRSRLLLVGGGSPDASGEPAIFDDF